MNYLPLNLCQLMSQYTFFMTKSATGSTHITSATFGCITQRNLFPIAMQHGIRRSSNQTISLLYIPQGHRLLIWFIFCMGGVLSNSSLENGTQVKTTFNSYWACVLTGSGQWFTVARKHFHTASISVSTREWSLVGRCNGTFPTSPLPFQQGSGRWWTCVKKAFPDRIHFPFNKKLS